MILYPELGRAKLKFNFALWKKFNKAKTIICKQSLGFVIRNIIHFHFIVRTSRGSKSCQRKASSIYREREDFRYKESPGHKRKPGYRDTYFKYRQVI